MSLTLEERVRMLELGAIRVSLINQQRWLAIRTMAYTHEMWEEDAATELGIDIETLRMNTE